MQMNHDIIKRLKNHSFINSGDDLGVISSFGKGAVIDAKDDTLDIVAPMTTSDIDLDDEVLDPNGADLSYFRANGKIFADHNYDMMSYVGVLRKIYPIDAGGKLIGWKMRFRPDDSPLGRACVRIVEHSGTIGTSVGFKVKDYGPPTDDELARYSTNGKTIRSVARAYEVFEVSTTCLPCNVICQGTSDSSQKTPSFTVSKNLELISVVEGLVTRGVIDRVTASLLGMPIQPKRKMFSVDDANSILSKRKQISYQDGLVLSKRV